MLLLVVAAGAVFLSFRQNDVALTLHKALETRNSLNHLLRLVTDAETGQRGYLLTGRLSYLEPFNLAKSQVRSELDLLGRAIGLNAAQQNSLTELSKVIGEKLAELQTTIDLRAANDQDAALAVVNSDAGKQMMARIREDVEQMLSEQQHLLEARAADFAWLSAVGSVVLIASVILVITLGMTVLLDGRRRLLQLQAAKNRLEDEIAERQTAESKVRQLQKMEAVGQLTGGIAHDFNNMLAIIIGSLDMARRRLTGAEHPTVPKCIKNAGEGAERAALLTSRLLAFSRQQPLEPRVLDPNKLVAGMSELLRSTIGEPIAVETVLAGGLWRVFADSAQLESAIVNLAVNARDAMPNGGKLTIETANTDLDERYARAQTEVTAGQYAMISITDTGFGMSTEVLERAFDPFYTTKRAGKGTGLGLSQVFGFVKQSGGHVKIYSEPGKGTSVKIYLPRYVGELDHSPRDGPIAVPPNGKAEEIILVVEDDAQVRNMSAEALRELGYAVIPVGTPGEALKQIEMQPRIALLFTDIVMPEMSGRELADRASKKLSNLKVLFTTGYTRNAIVHNGVVDPGMAFLPKPFTLDQLARKIRQAIDGIE